MSVFSHVHQLFNAEQCQAYIRTLRWKDRSFQCPRCQSHAIRPWGAYHYRPGFKRYWCTGCRRTFNDLTHTLLAQSKRGLSYWILATFLLCLSCSSRPGGSEGQLFGQVGALVHKYAQPIEFITLFDLTQKDVTC